jgi:glucose-6-phosphate 1-dehydrogenase
MIGDPTLFVRADMVEQTWRVVQPVLDTWANISAADLTIYPAGSAGRRRAVGKGRSQMARHRG